MDHYVIAIFVVVLVVTSATTVEAYTKERVPDHHLRSLSLLPNRMSSSANNNIDDSPQPPPAAAAQEQPQTIGELDSETGFYQSITVVSEIYEKRSKYQDIQVFETKHFGTALVLDGAVQITEKDADSYNEMMSHVPLFAHKNPKRVLIIGGGDGYVLKEVGTVKFMFLMLIDYIR